MSNPFVPELPLSPLQVRSFVEAQHRINLWAGAIRSGKTLGSLLRWMQYVANEAPRGGLLFMVGQSLTTLERNIIEPLQDRNLFGPLADAVVHTPNTQTATIFGRTVYLIGAKDAKAFGRIRGATAAGAYVDEATLLPANFLSELLGRLSLKGAKLFATTNPDGPAHWLKRGYIDRIDELDMGLWSFTLDDNPSLDPEYVKQVKAEHTGLWFQRLILGRWVAAEGVVYDAWNEDTMRVDVLPRIDRHIALGLDYGTTNPLDAVLIGLGKGDDGVTRLYVTGEWRHDPAVARQRLTDVQHSERLRDWLTQQPAYDGAGTIGVTPEWVTVDPSAASFMEQLHYDSMRGLTPADNAVLDGIRTVSSLMASDRLRVHSSCTGLLDELPAYSWDDKATEKGEDKPLKVADHAVDALRYGIHTTEALWRPYLTGR